ncbi:MAG: AraC family transcriptional regulator ligand-binding domain-containing protein [Rubrivivax sp.]|nr:AraC family transcriptional regulator ligand-binding domain-containing protein [Rubrivivax sp.]
MDPIHHTIAIQQVHGILLGARHRGLAVEPLLLQAGIAPALLESPLARISQLQYAALIRLLRRRLRDELWGLTDRPLKPGTFAHVMRRGVGCATLGEALRAGHAQLHLLLDDFVPRLQVHGGVARLRYVPRRASDTRLDYAIKATMLLGYGAASWLVARRIPLLSVDYTDGHRSAETSRVYQVPVRFGEPCVGLSFEARWLELPVVQSPQSLRDWLRGAPANLIVRYRDSSSVTDRIRRVLRKGLGGEMPSLDDVSAMLAVAPQTLRRRLQAEGRGFQQLKDETRRDAAIEWLLQTPWPLPEIAARLGFSEASTFHRAFKQWTGLAPGEYRQVHAAEEGRRGPVASVGTVASRPGDAPAASVPQTLLA